MYTVYARVYMHVLLRLMPRDERRTVLTPVHLLQVSASYFIKIVVVVFYSDLCMVIDETVESDALLLGTSDPSALHNSWPYSI